MKDRNFYIIILVLIVGFIGYVAYSNSKIQKTPEQPIVFKQGIHWHPQLAIFIKGKQQLIPPNLGENKFFSSPVHTHDSSGVLHWEMNGPVRKNMIRLGYFFGGWGKTFKSNQIFDYKNGPNGKLTMTVNGKPNTQFDNYQIKDNDQIEITYE